MVAKIIACAAIWGLFIAFTSWLLTHLPINLSQVGWQAIVATAIVTIIVLVTLAVVLAYVMMLIIRGG